MRETVDKRTKEKANYFLNVFQDNLFNSRLVNAFSSGYRKFRVSANDNEKTKKGCLIEAVYAFFLGKLRMVPSSEETFKDWQPIPLKLGIVTTSLALLVATILLSDNALTGKLAISTQGRKSSDFCATDNFDEKIKDFQDHIQGENVTNYDRAAKQFEKMSVLDENLDSDYTMDWIEKCESEHEIREGRRIKAACTVKEKVCIDSWGLSILCKTVSITIPGCIDRLTGELEIEQEEVALESDANVDDLYLEQPSAKLIQKLLKQIDIAGSLYSFYVIIALYFPTPMILFRPSYTVQFKQMLFGAGKIKFMAIVLMTYWLSDYVKTLLGYPEVRIFFKNLATDPCFLDGKFIANRTSIVKDTCEDLIQMENEWGLMKLKLDDFFDLKNSCTWPFPCQKLNGTYFHEDVGFDRVAFCYKDSSSEEIWTPTEFVGNETICTDSVYARDEILVANETDLSFWELWISSGLLANLLVKFTIANFGVALLKLADPFCLCNGKYESPPAEAMDHGLGEEEGRRNETSMHVSDETKKNKIIACKAIALRETIFWGFLSNISLVTLVIASSSLNLDDFKRLDIVAFSIIVNLSILASIGCYFLKQYSTRVVDNAMSSSNQEDTI